MGSLLSYSGISTKIRAMESRLICDRQLEEIVRMKDVTQIIAYLKQTPAYAKLWADLDESGWHREELEFHLRNSIFHDFSKLYHFANKEQRRFLDLYVKRYEVRILKSLITNIYDHRPNTSVDIHLYQDFFLKHFHMDLQKLSEASTMQDFLQELKGNEFYAPLQAVQGRNPLIFDDIMALDLYYFGQIWQVRKKIFARKDLEEITIAYGEKFDMLNLQFIDRSRRFYRMSPEQIYALLIPVNYKLSRDQIVALVTAPDENQWTEVFNRTYYGRKYQKLRAVSLEEFYHTALRSILDRLARQNPCSVAVLYHYMYSKEHEVDRLIIAIENVRYGVDPEISMRSIHQN